MSLRKPHEINGSTIYDICIIGSGPAGLTLCSELRNSNKRICVIESGNIGKADKYDTLKEVVSTGEIKIRRNSRERVLGGTSTTWSGLSSPLDQVDLEKWPIDYLELSKYYKELDKYGFPSYDEFNISKQDDIKESADFILRSNLLEEKIFVAKDPAWNFARELKPLINDAAIDIFIDSTVININLNSTDNNHADDISIIDSEEHKYILKAKQFIIACGGIESVRLLLTSNNILKNGIGNNFDQVGRYITNHPKNNYGFIELDKPVYNLDYLFGYLKSGWSKSSGIRLSDSFQKENNILNSYVRLEPMFRWTNGEGVTNLLLIVKKFKSLLTMWKNIQKKIIRLRDWSETGDDIQGSDNFSWIKSFSVVVKDFPAVLSYIVNRNFNTNIKVKKIRLRNFMDMEARAENRITLTKLLDVNGVPVPEVKINLSKKDKDSVIQLHKILSEELSRRRIGKLVSDISSVKEWPINAEASHHLGGTIMGNDPHNSVVDPNLKIHSVDNLYICSGSVFPTSGCANPTYTICALAIRLADHLKN